MGLSIYKTASLLKRSISFNKPHHVQWMLTRRCNYRCRSCEVWRDPEPANELSTEAVKAGLRILHQMGTMEIVLSGGNPLLRDDIDEIIEYASRYFVTTVYDNGSQAVRKIDSLRNADFVAISLDTLDEEKYDNLKGVHGALKNALKAVQTLHDEGINVGVSPTISQMNLYELPNFTKQFITKGVPVLYCLYQHDSLSQPMFQIGERDDELTIEDREGLAKVCDELITMKQTSNGVLITTKMLEALKSLYREEKRTWRCRALQSFFTVDPLGRVAGCHLQNPVGTIFELPRLWNTQRIQRLREEYQECDKCSYMCYMFYSLHADVKGNIEIIKDQWKNAKTLLTN